jgi:hypothetical protein
MAKGEEKRERGTDGAFVAIHGATSTTVKKIFADKRTKAHRFVKTKLEIMVEEAGGPSEVTPFQWDILDRMRKYLQDLYLYREYLENLGGVVNIYGQTPKVQEEYRRTELRYGALVNEFRSHIIEEKNDYQKMIEAMKEEEKDDQHE